MQAKILCIEGTQSGSQTFAAVLRKKGHQVEVVATGKAALAQLETNPIDVVVVNAASLRTTGTRICQSLRNWSESLPIILILEASDPTQESPANIILKLPFTIRKLDNRIRPFLPLESDKIIVAGAIELDLEHNQVRCQGRETQLTPRMAHLLELLMCKPGTVLSREDLFCTAWETTFTGDTRSLDVHISWLRRAIEADPRKPEFIKTLRGVGYRLDV